MIVTLTGTNDFARRAELKKLTELFVAKEGSLALEKLDAATIELGRLLDNVASLPFLSSRRMIIVDEPSKNKMITENITGVLGAVSDTTDLIINEPKPDKRSLYYKTLAKQTDLKRFDDTDPRNLARWLVDEASARGGHLQQADAQYLIDRVGANQLGLSNELDKLLLYNESVSHETITLMTEPTPQSTIFELIDAAFSGNARRTLELYREQRALKIEPQQIIAMLSWQLHVLAVVKAAGAMPPDDIARETKISPYTVRKTVGLARSRTMAQVKDIIGRTLRLDVRLKSESIDADDALQYLLMTI